MTKLKQQNLIMKRHKNKRHKTKRHKKTQKEKN